MKKRKPWGFFAGLCGIFAFYLTVAFGAVGLILGRIEAETPGQGNLFGTWWQILLFAADMLCVLGMAVFIVLAIRGRTSARRKATDAKEVTRETV